MNNPFDSPFALLDRADRHILDIQPAISDFVRDCCSAPFTEEDAPGINVRYKVKFSGDIPLSIAAIVFDVFSELRAALDHAVYAAAVVVAKIPEPDGTKFPFGDNAIDARKDFFRNRPPSGLDPLCDCCLKLEAYEGGRNESLWRLNKLRNGKIHRLLTPVASVGAGALIGAAGSHFKAKNLRTLSEWDSEKKEITFLSADSLETDREIRPKIDVAFKETAHFANASVIKTLRALEERTREAVGEIRNHAFDT